MAKLYPDWPDTVQEDRPPSWNVAPTSRAWVIREVELQPNLSLLKWGFTHDSTAKGLAPINARVETAASKYLFKESWNKRRCAVPADGWYEWKSLPNGKQPYFFTRQDREPLFFAGLWIENTFCMFTTEAEGELTSVHHRKPVSLSPDEAQSWIHEGMDTEKLIGSAIKAETITFHPVSKAVSNWRNDGAHLIEINSL